MKVSNGVKKSLDAKEIINILKKQGSILKKYGVRKIGLFGSYASGRQKRNSDIDFLAEFDKPNFNDFMDLVFFLENLFGKKVELITKGNLSPYIQPYVEKEIKWI